MDITIDQLSPGNDITRAQTFPKYDAALLAGNLESEDSDWTYNIQKAPNGEYAIFVYDEDGFALGYL